MWDTLYEHDEQAFGLKPNSFVATRFCRLRGQGEIPTTGKALVLACGQGRNALFLAKENYQVHAIDRSPVAIAQARRLAEARDLEISWQVADLLQLDSLPTLDLVVWCWWHLPRGAQQKFLRTLHRSLRSGAVLIFQGLREENLNYRNFGPPTAKLLYNLTQLLEDFAGYEILESGELDLVLDEGQQHQGMAAVVQLVVKKPL